MESRRQQIERLSQEQLLQAKQILETPVWETRELLNSSAGRVNLEIVERPYPEPLEAKLLREKLWNGKLEERISVLKQANPSNKYEVKLDNEGEGATYNKAVFQIDPDNAQKRIMWAGDTISMVPNGIKKEKGSTKIQVYKMNYSEVLACESKDYRDILAKNNIPVPDSGIGIVIMLETRDGLIPLTRRGIETPVYPGRLHSIGGNPKPSLNLVDNFKEEIEEEVGLLDGKDYDSKRMRILGIVSDKNFNGGPNPRPEIVAYLKVNASYRDVIAAQQRSLETTGQKQEDVWSLVPVATDRKSLESTIVFDGYQMCPPMEAGLSLLLFEKLQFSEGPNALKSLETTMNKVKSFERSDFTPPIKRLGR